MILTAILSYIAGVLTVLAPCVLPLLPVILGGSFDSSDKDRRRPYIITASLVVSLILFTILLKASTALIGIDPRVWSVASGLLVVTLGLFMLMPDLWAKVMVKLGFEHRSQGLLNKAFGQKNKTWSAILTGAALGPVFSSCSPTYGWLIATVLPNNAVSGVIYLAIYCLGLATALLAIALLGRNLLGKISWASNPKGWFQRIIAVTFILVGVFVATGWDKKVQTWLVDKDVFNLIQIERNLVPDGTSSPAISEDKKVSGKDYFNVEPYSAPELIGTGDWFNSAPLKLEELKGKVVLIDFWTYSCINCIRTLPYLQKWNETYKDDGLVIIGVHAPEFAFEKVSSNVSRAIKEKGLTYPVVQDNDFKTWSAYKNKFWPATYLIDKDGKVRREHFGEGEYEITEKAIRDLLAENGGVLNDKLTINGSTAPPINKDQTPETYLGYDRGERFASVGDFKSDTTEDYSEISDLDPGEWALGGKWKVGGLDTISEQDGAKLKIKFSAKEVYLVMNGNGAPAQATLNGQAITSGNLGGSDIGMDGNFYPKEARLYKIVKSSDFIRDGVLELTLPTGVSVNAFTFGS